ncbi:MAG: DNA polymerase I [Endomicrobium sp.]|jgi:DNA polymerase-1|nr:DNA polymerase I [Endomicrobium sp.]
MKRFFIIDGNAYIHRAYHALPPLTTTNNQQVNAVYGFIKLLFKIKNNFKPDFMIVCFDFPSKNFRHQIFVEYKANRKPLEVGLISQMPIAREVVDGLDIKKIEIKGYESDDLIATLVEKNKQNNVETVIVTGDKDILQLVDNSQNVLVWNDSKDVMYDDNKVVEKYGISPVQIVDMLSLMGDSVDNVPGIKGIGEKTAIKLVQEYNTLENILKNASSIKGNVGKLLCQYRDSALLSKKLVELKKDVPLEYNLEDFRTKNLNLDKAISFFEKYEFKSLIEKVSPKVNSNMKSNQEKDSQLNNSFEISFEVVSSIQKATEIASLIQETKIFSLKTVTSLQDSLKAQIVGVSLSIEHEKNIKSFYFPIGHSDLTAWQITLKEFESIFKPIFISVEIKIIGHDLKQERNIYSTNKITSNNMFFDTMLAAYCLNSQESHDIFDIAKKYLNFHVDDAYLAKNIRKVIFADAPAEFCAKYASTVSCLAFTIYKVFYSQIEKNKLTNLFFDIEMPLIEVLSEMEIAGIKVDHSFLHKFNEQIVLELKKSEHEIYKIADKEFNINSPRQLANIMFEKLQLPIIKKTKTGYSTDEEVLLELSSYKIASEILKYRELQKIKSTYIDPITNYCAYYGDRIHTVFNQAITTTGRLSSTEPNLQNIPIKSTYGKKFRKVFIAKEETVFVSADYSQIDLRVLAHLSGDKKLIEDFNNGADIHNATAREIFNIPEPEPLPENLRSAAKAINFGIVYGISPFGLSRQLNVNILQAKEYIDNYLARYEGVKLWMSQVVSQALKRGYVCTITGRMRYMPELTSPITRIKNAGERIALNMPVQGSSADIIKIAMINIYKELKKNNRKSLMLLQVHDDLLFEVPKKEKENLISLIKEKMENVVSLKVPLFVDIKVGANWGQMQKYGYFNS